MAKSRVNDRPNGGNFGVFALPSFQSGSYVEADIDEFGNRIRRRKRHAKARTGCTNCKRRKIKASLPWGVHYDTREKNVRLGLGGSFVRLSLMCAQCDEGSPSCRNCANQKAPCSLNGSNTPSLSPPTGPDDATPPWHGEANSSGSSNHPGRHRRNSDISTFEIGAELKPVVSMQKDEVDLDLNHLDMQPMKLLHQFEMYTCETLMFDPSLWRLVVIPLALKVRNLRYLRFFS
jgi:hypothetical protein